MYSRYEREQNELPIRFLRELCLFFHVSADYILDLDPELLYNTPYPFNNPRIPEKQPETDDDIPSDSGAAFNPYSGPDESLIDPASFFDAIKDPAAQISDYEESTDL